MKDFRKDKNNLFICEECGTTFKSIHGLSTHITVKHKYSNKNYIKWENEYCS